MEPILDPRHFCKFQIVTNLRLITFALQPDPCVWYQCIDPPLPAGLNLKHNFDGTPVEFGDFVRYECVNDRYFFEEDYTKIYFELQCQTNGFFLQPAVWSRCVDSINNFLKHL